MGKRDLDDALSVVARAEYQLVGSLLQAEPDLCVKLLTDVRCDDLLEPALRAIVRAMKECEEASSPISVFTVAAKLGTALDRMGGLAWLAYAKVPRSSFSETPSTIVTWRGSSPGG